tara:strand:- start:71 stop:427 length:357 start_codon:yes stop_codon:yes gene_type:complete
MYTFNFNLGGGQNTPDTHDFEPIVKALKDITEDWQSFYNLYKRFAPPPEENQAQIQAWFKEIKTALDAIIELYNKIPNSPNMDNIHGPEEAENMLNQFVELNKLFQPDKPDTDTTGYN